MAGDFLSHFTKKPSPLQDDEIRRSLTEALISGDAAEFRRILGEVDAGLLEEPRLYHVMAPPNSDIPQILADQNGQPLPPGYVIPAGMPIEMLNVTITPTEMRLTYGDDVWVAPVAQPDAPRPNDTDGE